MKWRSYPAKLNDDFRAESFPVFASCLKGKFFISQHKSASNQLRYYFHAGALGPTFQHGWKLADGNLCHIMSPPPFIATVNAHHPEIKLPLTPHKASARRPQTTTHFAKSPKLTTLEIYSDVNRDRCAGADFHSQSCADVAVSRTDYNFYYTLHLSSNLSFVKGGKRIMKIMV